MQNKFEQQRNTFFIKLTDIQFIIVEIKAEPDWLGQTGSSKCLIHH